MVRNDNHHTQNRRIIIQIQNKSLSLTYKPTPSTMSKILDFFHVHCHSKTVVSGYVSFNSRDVISECQCGHRKMTRMSHEQIYPFPTVSLSTKDVRYYLTPGNTVTTEHQITMLCQLNVSEQMNIPLTPPKEIHPKKPNMKYLLPILLSIMIMSCGNNNNITKTYHNDFTVSNDTIFYLDKPVAIYLNIEWEYIRNHKYIEISIRQLNGGLDEMTDNIAIYIRKRHPSAKKVEIKIPKEWNTDHNP